MTEEGSEALSRRTLMRAVGGGALAASAGAASAAETETPSDEDGGGGGGGSFTWTIDMTDGNVFDPDEKEVRPGDTVVWENVGSVGHTVTAYEDDIPEEAEYWASGGFDSESAAKDGYPDQGLLDGGETFEHTFEVEGTHEYFCIPHEGAGMVGSIVVTPDAATPTATPEAAPPALPPTAKAIGVGAAGLLASTLGLAYAFIKYGASGGDE